MELGLIPRVSPARSQQPRGPLPFSCLFAHRQRVHDFSGLRQPGFGSPVWCLPPFATRSARPSAAPYRLAADTHIRLGEGGGRSRAGRQVTTCAKSARFARAIQNRRSPACRCGRAVERFIAGSCCQRASLSKPFLGDKRSPAPDRSRSKGPACVDRCWHRPGDQSGRVLARVSPETREIVNETTSLFGMCLYQIPPPIKLIGPALGGCRPAMKRIEIRWMRRPSTSICP